jgi:hypothetical protein
LRRYDMAVIKVNKTKDYTIMSNTHFRERDMSLKAKGLYRLCCPCQVIGIIR